MSATREPDLVIGVGNEWRGDDGVGPAIARACAGRVPDGTEVVVLDGEPARLVDAWTDRRRVVAVDATSSGREPGHLTRFEVGVDDLPAGAPPASSHGLGIVAAVELGRALGQLPAALVVLGVEGTDFGTGAGLSPPVELAVAPAVARVLAELAPSVVEGRHVPR